MSRKKTGTRYAFLLPFAKTVGFIAIAVLLNCADVPTPASPTRWEKVTDAPEGAVDLAVTADDEVWMVGAEDGRAAIWRWDGSRVARAFTYPRGESKFKGIDARDGGTWAAGWVSESGDQNGILFQYTSDRWEEIKPVPEVTLGFYGVASAGGAGCWLVNPDKLFRYSDGNWETYAGSDSIAGITRQSGPGVFAWRESGGEIWAFDGAQWRPENVDSPPDFVHGGFTNGASSARFSYFESFFMRSDIYYRSIYRRDDAPAGAGNYDLFFFAPHGPYFYTIADFAFADDDNGVAVGYLTSVVWEGGEPHQEICDESFKTPFAVAALAPGDYWMLSRDEEGRQFLWRWNK